MDGNELNQPLPSQEITTYHRTMTKAQQIQPSEKLKVPLANKNKEQRDHGVTQSQSGVIPIVTQAQIHGETNSSNNQTQPKNPDMDIQMDIANQLLLLGSQQQTTSSMEVETDGGLWTDIPSKKRKNDPGPPPMPTPKRDDNYYSLLNNFVILSSVKLYDVGS